MSTIIATSYMIATTPLQPGTFEPKFEGFTTETQVRAAQDKITRGEYFPHQDIVIGGFDFRLDLLKTEVYDNGAVITTLIGGTEWQN